MKTDERSLESSPTEGLRRALGEVVRRFDPLDRAILEARLGLHGRRRQSLTDTATTFGVLPTKIRRVEAELGARLRVSEPGVAHHCAEVLLEADRRDAVADASPGVPPAIGRRGRGARRSAPVDVPRLTDPGRERGGRSPDLPDKEALAPILPGLTRTQILVADELYGLVSGAPAAPADAAARLGLREGEVRRIDRLVRRLVAARRDPSTAAHGAGAAVVGEKGSERDTSEAPDAGS
ncbi:MAG: hypothetical protein M3Q10_17670 [Chloroflexota bacterium]|nr:hypothetical protein [Chloroflexota bacterium]